LPRACDVFAVFLANELPMHGALSLLAGYPMC